MILDKPTKLLGRETISAKQPQPRNTIGIVSFERALHLTIYNQPDVREHFFFIQFFSMILWLHYLDQVTTHRYSRSLLYTPVKLWFLGGNFLGLMPNMLLSKLSTRSVISRMTGTFLIKSSSLLIPAGYKAHKTTISILKLKRKEERTERLKLLVWRWQLLIIAVLC